MVGRRRETQPRVIWPPRIEMLFGVWSSFTLRGKIVVPFLLLTVLTALVGTFVVTRLVAGSSRERFTNQLYESSRLAAAAVVDRESLHLSILRLMVFTEGLPEALLAEENDRLDALLRPLAGNAGIEAWAVLDATGSALMTRVASPNALAGAYDPIDAEWRSEPAVIQVLAHERDATGDKMIGLASLSDEAYFYTAAPITSDDGRVLGAIVVGTRLDTLLDMLRQRSNAQQVLLTRAGVFQASTLTVDRALLALSPAQATAVDQSPARPIEIAGAHYEALYTSLIIRGQPVGVLVTLLPTEFVISAEATSRNAIAVVFLGLVAATTLLGLGLAVAISAPIRRLNAITQQVADGDLTQATGIDSGDEIGRLARSFDQMTAHLRHRTAQSETLQIATRELYEQALERGQQLAAANQQLAAAQAHLVQREKIALMGKVASHIAQDVRAPLTAALTLMDLLELELGSEGQEQLTQIRAHAERAGRLLSNIDRFAHPAESERMLMDLRLALGSALDGQADAFATAGVAATIDLPPGPMYATLEPGQIRQAFGTLIHHRLRALQPGDTVTLRLRASTESGLAGITLCDTGPSILPEQADGFFDPVFDIDADALSRRLELAVSYGLIAEHGGRIDVHSRSDSPERFTIWLPYDDGQGASDRPIADHVARIVVQTAPDAAVVDARDPGSPEPERR